jgi:hypothetical protein
MKRENSSLIIFLSILQLFVGNVLSAQEEIQLTYFTEQGRWIIPSDCFPALPVWGHKEGIRIGIAPTPGPRGLIRIYTPYLGHREDKMINFIAIEPIVLGDDQRGFSELEMSEQDGVRGKRLWSGNRPECRDPASPTSPARGLIEVIDGVETLTLYLFTETFQNGARPYVRVRFYENSPYELELTTYCCPGSKELEHLILTTTMGNFARLRRLYLSDSVKHSTELWPLYDDVHFTDHDSTPIESMIKDNNGGAYFIAEPDESNPAKASYAPGTGKNWIYCGKKATQYWYVPNPDPSMVGLVNGRYTYWESNTPIPGGVAFENFEIKSPFKQGEKFLFGVVPFTANELIKQIANDE